MYNWSKPIKIHAIGKLWKQDLLLHYFFTAEHTHTHLAHANPLAINTHTSLAHSHFTYLRVPSNFRERERGRGAKLARES
jgi:hypothetical protein